ncbi:NAD(P)/FAD-dependent oxidoreductase [Sporichthya sp.]|uniref:flavin-containing monooxygenase n=1 Tax=Sporichthya sp. TaxID=65475 RepID=UPI00179D9E7E|nr:NAD(P)/FAD-dependent oxidoreductase [Sporichthya sp.]MBA3745059.1 NAD(P)/FAD-dependent oxidoreductase [Sporichthya sp.]
MTTHYDAVIVGGGFAGVRSLWETRQLGLSARVLEAGTSVGGTWYWNRYPGARTDSEAWTYCFSFDDKLCQEWNWTERFPGQPEVEAYFNHAVDSLDLRKDIQFTTRVNGCTYDEASNTWTVSTTDGETFTCRYLISATGLLHLALKPPFPGLDSFRGEWMMTAKWPKEPVDFAGKKVVLIGTGATGVQLIPVVARDAAQLTVLQRTPNYVVPTRNHALEPNHLAEIKRNYDKIWAQTDVQVFAFAMDAANRMSTDVPKDQWNQVFDAGWEAGGFRFLFETFDDLLVNTEVNEAAAEYVRNKIRAIVKDPATADLLCPTYYYGGKRPPMGTHYYESFNRENVKLVSVANNAITDVTETGVRLADGTVHEADVIVFALGFDAMTGALAQMNVRGTDGRTLQEKWNPEPATFMGITVDGYPNFFMLSGPQSPFANIPVVIDKSVKFIGGAIRKAQSVGADVIEPTAEAASAYNEHCKMLLDFNTIIKSGTSQHSWFLGANVEGKSQSAVYFYFGGAAGFFGELNGVMEKDFEGLSFSKHADKAVV